MNRSPWVDLSRPYLNCGIAGECYIGKTNWKDVRAACAARRWRVESGASLTAPQIFLTGCPAHNRIFGGCQTSKDCTGGSYCVGSTGLCYNVSRRAAPHGHFADLTARPCLRRAQGSDLSQVRQCVSDSVLASLPNASRGTPGPAEWPKRWEFNEVHGLGDSPCAPCATAARRGSRMLMRAVGSTPAPPRPTTRTTAPPTSTCRPASAPTRTGAGSARGGLARLLAVELMRVALAGRCGSRKFAGADPTRSRTTTLQAPTAARSSDRGCVPGGGAHAHRADVQPQQHVHDPLLP
jgi:hypothetical protein